MSVIVRGMDMPKDCFECMVDCPVGTQRFIVIGRPRGCPLVEVDEKLFSAENARKFLRENPPKEGSET